MPSIVSIVNSHTLSSSDSQRLTLLSNRKRRNFAPEFLNGINFLTGL